MGPSKQARTRAHEIVSTSIIILTNLNALYKYIYIYNIINTYWS